MDDFEDKIFINFRNSFDLLLDKEELKNNNKEKVGKLNKYNDGIIFSKIFCSSYNNIDGQEHEEKYQSQGKKTN